MRTRTPRFIASAAFPTFLAMFDKMQPPVGQRADPDDESTDLGLLDPRPELIDRRLDRGRRDPPEALPVEGARLVQPARRTLQRSEQVNVIGILRTLGGLIAAVDDDPGRPDR